MHRNSFGTSFTVAAALAFTLGCGTSTIRAPTPLQPSQLTVASESIHVDCATDGDEHLACDVRASTRIENTKDRTELVAVKVASNDGRAQLAVDGVEKDSQRSSGELKTVVQVPPRGHRTITLGAQPYLVAAKEVGWYQPGLQTRHLVFGEDPWEPRATLVLCPAAEGAWRSARPSTVHVSEARPWSFDGDGSWVASADGTQTNDDVDSCITLHWYPKRRYPPVFNGGPVVGLGGSLGDGFRARLGYEVGLGRSLIAGGHLEVDQNPPCWQRCLKRRRQPASSSLRSGPASGFPCV